MPGQQGGQHWALRAKSTDSVPLDHKPFLGGEGVWAGGEGQGRRGAVLPVRASVYNPRVLVN